MQEMLPTNTTFNIAHKQIDMANKKNDIKKNDL